MPFDSIYKNSYILNAYIVIYAGSVNYWAAGQAILPEDAPDLRGE